jgi:aromatic ring hydroxylase
MKKLYNEEINDLYSSPNIVRVTKSRRIRWAANASCSTFGGRTEVYTRFWWGNLREKDHMEDPGVDGSIVLI